jgi:hypothetical protein
MDSTDEGAGSEAFTDEDRADLDVVIDEVVDRLKDELRDSCCMRDMYRPFQEMIVRFLMCGDEAFGQMASDLPGDDQGAIDAGLQSACKRMLSSGRFDIDPEEYC